MTWSWAFVGPSGSEIAVEGVAEDQSFPTQSDAETWLGEEWRTLAEAGVAAVTLREETRAVYGPMSLSPE